jgi:hypothetical protein
MCWAWGRDAPIGRETAEFLRQMHPKSLKHHVWYVGYTFSVRTNVICERFLIFFIVAGLGSVEVSWAGENRDNTHSQKSIPWLFRDWVCCFCFNWCDLHIRSIWLGPRRQLGCDSAIAAKHAFFSMTESGPICLTLFLCETDTHLDFMLEYADQERACEHCAKYFLVTYLLVFWAVVSWFVDALQVLVWFQGLSTSPFFVRGSVCLCLVQSLPCTMIYKEGTCLEGLHMSAYFAHSHVQHKI